MRCDSISIEVPWHVLLVKSEIKELKNGIHLNICHGNSNRVVTGFGENVVD